MRYREMGCGVLAKAIMKEDDLIKLFCGLCVERKFGKVVTCGIWCVGVDIN